MQATFSFNLPDNIVAMQALALKPFATCVTGCVTNLSRSKILLKVEATFCEK